MLGRWLGMYNCTDTQLISVLPVRKPMSTARAALQQGLERMSATGLGSDEMDPTFLAGGTSPVVLRKAFNTMDAGYIGIRYCG